VSPTFRVLGKFGANAGLRPTACNVSDLGSRDAEQIRDQTKKAKVVRQTTVAVALTLAVVAVILLLVLLWPLGRLPSP
jgi:hypothetical protein